MASRRKQPSKRPGRPAGGNTLTPEAVARAAAQIIDAEGEAGLSMRRLGQMLGVKATAFYNHFPDKSSILDAVADLATRLIPAPQLGGSWRKRIKDLCLGARRMALDHPHLFRLAMSRPSLVAGALPLVEGALAAFSDAGLTPAEQATAFHTCFLYVRGYCLWEIEELRAGRRTRPPMLDAAGPRLPRLAAAARWMFAPDLDRQFTDGLETILRGISAHCRGQ